MRTITFSIEDEQRKKLRDLAKRTHILSAELLRLALGDLLKHEERLNKRKRVSRGMNRIKTFSIEDEQRKKLRDLAKRTHNTEAELIRFALKDLLEHEERLKMILGRIGKDPNFHSEKSKLE